MDCSICCSEITKKNKILKCNHCDINACHGCNKKYICESSGDPHCMNCKTGFTQYFLRENFTKSFMDNEYKISRSNILFDREKALMPQTQNDVEDFIHKRQIKEKLSILKTQRKEILENLRNLNDEIYLLEHGTHTHTHTRKVYTLKCQSEGCRGFVEENIECKICNKKTCTKCNEIMEENHECKEENIETMKLLKQDSKPCPGCGITISKIVGCSQMWCTNCHTTFCFRTGEKVLGVIHNPHYYEFLRNNNGNRLLQRNPQDVPCGGLPNIRLFLQSLRKRNVNDNDIKKITTIHSHISHIIYMELPNVTTHGYNQNTYRKERILYMINERTEKQIKSMLFKSEKDRITNKEFGEILTMFTHTSSELMEKLHHDLRENLDYDLQEFYTIIENLRKYANTNFEKVGKSFDRKYPIVCNDWKYWRYYNDGDS